MVIGTLTCVCTRMPPSWLIQSNLYGLGWGRGVKANLVRNLELQQLQQESLSTMTEQILFKTVQYVLNWFFHCDSSNSKGVLFKIFLTTNNSSVHGWISSSEGGVSSKVVVSSSLEDE